MKLKVDGNEITDMKEFNACKTFDELFLPLKNIVDKKKRIISRITVDDIELSSESEQVLKDKPLNTIALLDVETDSAENLARVTLANSQTFLDSFKNQVDKFISVLQTGGEEDAYDVFVDDLKGFSVVLQAVSVVKSFIKSDFSKLASGDQTADIVVAETEDILRQLAAALKEADSVYVQDLLRYELVPNVDKIKSLVAALSSSISNQQL